MIEPAGHVAGPFISEVRDGISFCHRVTLGTDLIDVLRVMVEASDGINQPDSVRDISQFTQNSLL